MKSSNIYHGIITAIFLSLLWLRRESILNGSTSNFDLLLLAIAGALLLIPLFNQVSLGGVTITREIEKAREKISGEISDLRATISNRVDVSPTFNVQLREMVSKEVSRAQQEALRLMAEIDLQMVPLWERENSSAPNGYTGQKLELVEKQIADMESRLKDAPEEDKVYYAEVLRSLYWMLIEVGRKHYASSAPYKEIRRRVEGAFSNLATLGKKE